jgi:putative NIF3 family GTP cyclohydrolase 1 type 2
MAVMALDRAGSTPSTGLYKDTVYKAVNFVCDQIERSDADSLYVTDLRGTRTQMKLGNYIDTFFAAQMLSELKSHMPTDAASQRVNDALAKVIHKIEKNQQENGQWANKGWATTLAQAAAAKSINAAAANGVVVNEQVRQRAEEFARADFRGGNTAGGGGGGATAGVPGVITGAAIDSSAIRAEPFSGPVSGSAGDAGVKLYSSGSQIAAMQASKSVNDSRRARYEDLTKSPTTSPAARKEAVDMLARFDANDRDLAAAQHQVVANSGDSRFIAGFGSNGGEEFLSYLNIGESLYAAGGEDWGKWDDRTTANLVKVQNDDGSWSGSHCITGRTFCTSAALMVLTIDRSPAMPPAGAHADAR